MLIRFLIFVVMMAAAAGAAEFRLGIVGTDTSHVVAFTRILNDPAAPGHVAGVRVVAAFKGGSPDLPKSSERIQGFTQELRTKFGVEIVPDIATLCSRVDGVLLESMDGRIHLQQMREIAAAGKPVFIDKPLAATLDDARAIAKVANDAGVPWFTSSSLRYSALAESMKFPDATGYFVFGPGPTDPSHSLDMTWYGLHSAELLFTLMGRGCEEVTRTFTADADETVCKWKAGRLGTVRIIRPYSEFGVVAFRPKDIVRSAPKPDTGYAELMREVVRFFQTGKAPVDPSETLEIFEFMEAAQRSEDSGGRPVKLSSVQAH